ncbi:hypothetical protein [Methylotuvimicrobium sp. KM2]|uniref:hypothetical protein n=1 Tax=Methylotuvimicrobium sp. KM2 TaxID=3133976 RepID=UPI00310157F5
MQASEEPAPSLMLVEVILRMFLIINSCTVRKLNWIYFRGHVCGFYGNAILFGSKARKQAHSKPM